VLGWWSNRRLAIDAPPPSRVEQGRLPGVFWIAAAMLFCTTPPEWCITAWGATFVADAADVSTDTAVALMAGYFGGVLAGRTLGSRLARRHDPARLLAFALALTGAGLAVPWPSTAPATVLLGLALLGIGLGNLFPMGLGVTVSLAPERAALASGRAVAMPSFAVLLAPLTVGALADATSLDRRARDRAGDARARRGRARARASRGLGAERVGHARDRPDQLLEQRGVGRVVRPQPG
jgi:MFS family permease